MLELTSRQSLFELNSELISQLQNRLSAKRYSPNEEDSSKLGFINSLIEALKVQNKILEFAEIEEIREEINRLKWCR